MDDRIKEAIEKKLAIPLLDAGEALGYGPDATYAGAKRGDIPVIRIGKQQNVPTSWLRRVLLIDQQNIA